MKIGKKDKDKWWLKTKKYNYHDPKCFGYSSILFEKIKHLGSVVIKKVVSYRFTVHLKQILIYI